MMDNPGEDWLHSLQTTINHLN